MAHDGGFGCGACGAGEGTCVFVDVSGLGVITTVWDWLNQVNAANVAGHDDWRLPSEEGRNVCPTCDPRELETIWNCPGFPLPCIDPIFGAVGFHNYWSATSLATDPGFTWVVNFEEPLVSSLGKSGSTFVRAVRSAP
jgi:hypothetical protein